MAVTGVSGCCSRYLLLLAQEHLEFRLPELKALFSVFGADLEYDKITSPEKEPFLVVKNVDEETVRKVMARTVCAKSAYEIWGTGRTLDELVTSLRTYPKHRMSPFCKADSTFKISVHSFNKTLPQADRLNKIEALSFLPWDGKVNLSAPDHTFCLLENYAGDVNNIPNDPCQVFFGRWLTDGQRDLIRRYSIKTRHFIGNTSMDATLSFIMANHARVKPQDVVFDPFVGTGSLLVASAHYGAYVTGGDIDYNTIHGIGKASRRNQVWRGPDESIKSNLCQYGLQDRYLDVFVGDASRPPWREGPLFNAIITDPPYGVREATRRTRPRKGRMPDAANLMWSDCVTSTPLETSGPQVQGQTFAFPSVLHIICATSLLTCLILRWSSWKSAGAWCTGFQSTFQSTRRTSFPSTPVFRSSVTASRSSRATQHDVSLPWRRSKGLRSDVTFQGSWMQNAIPTNGTMPFGKSILVVSLPGASSMKEREAVKTPDGCEHSNISRSIKTMCWTRTPGL
uniref:tRNA (guanine(10)-N2)-methyltransferase homolog isoform X1 n=2 Tax=Myxine glutinosa TaxID=7769 RepID=UPI00358F6BA9